MDTEYIYLGITMIIGLFVIIHQIRSYNRFKIEVDELNLGMKEKLSQVKQNIRECEGLMPGEYTFIEIPKEAYLINIQPDFKEDSCDNLLIWHLDNSTWGYKNIGSDKFKIHRILNLSYATIVMINKVKSDPPNVTVISEPILNF